MCKYQGNTKGAKYGTKQEWTVDTVGGHTCAHDEDSHVLRASDDGKIRNFFCNSCQNTCLTIKK